MRGSSRLSGRLSLVFLACLTSALIAQTPAQAPSQTSAPAAAAGNTGSQDFQIKVDVELVQLPVTVMDKEGRIIAGLEQKNFKVFEDNVAQELSLFQHEDVPISLGIVLDNSGSMRTKRDRVHSAALTFVRESNPDDETFVIAFDDQAWLQQDFTGSIGDLVDALENLDPRLETAMHDAIYLGVDHIKKGKLDKKVVLIISDGEDTASVLKYDKVLAHVRNAKDVAIYAIGLLEQDRGGGFLGIGGSSQKKAREGLTEIAEVSGGKAFFPKTVDEVEAICRQIARELRNQYTLGYAPKNEKQDGTWRQVRVEVVEPPKNAGKVTVNAKKGYFAPVP